MVSSADAIALAKVNGVSITDKAVNNRLRSYLRQIGHQQLSDIRTAALQKQILKKLIEEELLYQEGLKKGLPIPEQEIEIGITQIRNRFPSESAFQKALSKEVLNPDDIRKGVERSVLIKKTWDELLKMSENDRTQRLQEMTDSAKIQMSTTRVEEAFTHHQ